MPRYYVTITWEDWPEGGSYGTVLEAADNDAAEKACRLEMAAARVDPPEPDDPDPEDAAEAAAMYLRDFGDDWHVVDCFDLDAFIEEHRK